MQHVVVKFVFFVPQADILAAKIIHRRGNTEKVFKKLRRDIFVNMIFGRQLDGNAHHVQRKHSHPTSAVALLEMAAVGEGSVAIEDPDVIEPEKSALENVVALGVFAIHPPGEGDEHLMKECFKKRAVTFAPLFALDLINAPRRPRDHGGINVSEIPLVGRHLSVRSLVPFTHYEIELALGEMRIDKGKGDAVKRKIPRCVPRIFPFVRHRHDALVVEMGPVGVAAILAFLGRRRLAWIAFQPFLNDVVIKLFAPEHPGQRLTLNSFVFGA